MAATLRGAHAGAQQSLPDMGLLRLFGHPVLERDGTRTPIGVPPKAVALLAVLAANHTRPLSREWLAQSVWPDAGPADARANLRRHLHLLSRAIGEDVFLLTRHTAQWNPESCTAVDTVRFETFSAAQPALAAQEYGGELCAGIEDDILDPLRLRYRSAYEALLRKLTESARASKDDAALAIWLQHAINHDPFDESTVREMMLLRRRHADRAGALREYNALAQRLRTELGSEPDAQTAALYTEIACGEVESNAPHNLRPHATTFVGRERELAEIVQALEAHGMITLTGPGGIGKSRLATRACFDVLPAYPHGVWLIELDNCRNASGIWERIATAMKLPPSAVPEKHVLEYLARARVLLLFDTCEHVLDDARGVAQTILGSTGTRILATSRRALRMPQEHLIALGPLEIPPARRRGGESALRFAAYRLFLERAAMINPTFRVDPRQERALTEVLQQIDGLPLAIELVASRANVLTIEGMRKRLAVAMRAGQRTATGRAQTIDDTIAWSYDLLTGEQRQVFAWLSVFKGPFEMEDVDSVCAGFEHLTESLFELVDASLVSIVAGDGHTRYRLLETTRAFALDKLSGAGHRAAKAHAKYFATKADAMARAADKELSHLLESTLHSMPDFLAAFEYATASEDIDTGLRLLEGLHKFGVRNHYHEEILSAALRLAECERCTAAARARVSRIAGMLSEACGRYQQAIPLYETAVQYYRATHDDLRLSDALTGLAIMAYHLGRYDECERRFIEIREQSERAGDTLLFLKTLGRLGALYLSQGEFEKSLPLLERAALGLPELGELRQSGTALKNVATAAHYAGRHEEAVGWTDRALAYIDATGELPMRAAALCVRAAAQRELGNLSAAVESLAAANSLFSILGNSSDLAECLEDAASTLAACDSNEVAARAIGFCEALRRSTGSPLNPGLRLFYDRTCAALERSLGASFEAYRTLGAHETADAMCELVGDAVLRLRSALAEANKRPSP